MIQLLIFLIRCVDVAFIIGKVSIKESFLGFIEIHAKDAASIENTVLSLFLMCRVTKKIIKNSLRKAVKRESDTLWSARIQTVSFIVDGLENIVKLY